MKPLIVKLGGSVITDKCKRFSVKRAVLRRLGRELTVAKGPLIVVHGGGSFGHPLALKYKITSGYKSKGQLMGLTLTHRAMELLNSYVIEALQNAGAPAIAVQASGCTIVSGGRIKSMEIKPIKRMLALGLVPVLYGDVVLDVKRGINILSGDQIVAFLARRLRASRVIMGSNVDGVYAGGSEGKNRAKLMRKITPKNVKLVASLGVDGPNDVTGGMRNKVLELVKLARMGIESKIVNALKPNVLKKEIQRKQVVGTKISWRR